MYMEERLILIIKELDKYGRLNVKNLSAKFKVSPMTIRRDLHILQERGFLLKSYGGAIASESLSQDKLYVARKKENAEKKKKIVEKAVSFIKSGMTILLDAGTTNYKLAQLLAVGTIYNLTVITNDLRIAFVLAVKKNFQVVMLGGLIDNESMLTCGAMTTDMLQELEIDLCFMGTQAINEKFEIRTPNMAKVDLKKTYLEKSKQRFLLTDSSKFDKSKLYKICDLKDFDYIITDKEMTPPEKKYIDKYKTIWLPA